MVNRDQLRNMYSLCQLEIQGLARMKSRDAESKMIFVVGTGRSGTHFMDSIINSHPRATDLNDGKENPQVFGKVTLAAINNTRLSPRTIRNYRLLKRVAGGLDLVDQSHPNLWHVEQLLDNFPNAKFVAMIRCPYSVAYSTLKHKAVPGWLKNYKDYPVPNQFLGINHENINEYAHYGLAGKSTIRWLAHVKRICEIKKRYNDSVFVMNYEDLCVNPKNKLEELRVFLGYEENFEAPKVNLESLEKKNHLLDEDKNEIGRILEMHSDECFDLLSDGVVKALNFKTM